MKRSKENVIAVSINKSLTQKKTENMRVLEKQVTNIILRNKTKKFYTLDKTGIECKIQYKM